MQYPPHPAGRERGGNPRPLGAEAGAGRALAGIGDALVERATQACHCPPQQALSRSLAAEGVGDPMHEDAQIHQQVPDDQPEQGEGQQIHVAGRAHRIHQDAQGEGQGHQHAAHPGPPVAPAGQTFEGLGPITQPFHC
ncbi:MAG: hypothetical protein IPJ73_10765 [Zoogloea sp.]|nr:hypothetical protein [Zoogloea sp.]